MSESKTTKPPVNRPPGTVVPWEEKKKEYGELPGDEAVVKQIWEETDGMAYVYIWQCLLSL